MVTATDRQERVAWWRQDCLNRANVAVIGAGALGNEVLKNLALMGVGHLHIFDLDKIEVSNLSRAILFGPDSLDKPKALIAAERTMALNVNPIATVKGQRLDVVWDLGGGYLRRMDVVLGCLDNLEARVAVGKSCYQFGVPFIDGGIRELGGRVQLHRTGFGACMDCAVGDGERRSLRKRYACLSVLRSYSPEEIVPTVQVSSAFVSALMCQETIKFLQGVAVPFGHVISWFGETNDFDVLKLIRNPVCPSCSEQPPPLFKMPFGASDSAAVFLSALGPSWSVRLPSPFIVRLRCGLCGRVRVMLRPSHRCLDTDLFCASCDSAELVELESRDALNLSLSDEILAMSLADLGVPRLAALYADNGAETRLVELSNDAAIVGVTE